MAVLQMLNRRHGITVVIVTHDSSIAHHTGRIVYLHDGRISREEAVKEPLVAERGDGLL
jgi:ABC-type lipoprotein export system ATPase subunit